MSPPDADAVTALPTFVALDARTVLESERRGASVQVDESYFRGQRRAIDAFETASGLSDRRHVVTQSHHLYDQIQIDFDSLSRENLQTASVKFREVLQQLPELQYLKGNFPGTCFIVPEWLRTQGRVNYGARIYFFREESAPTPGEVVERNIESVVNEDRDDFEQYQGELHGYPDCCVDYFSSTSREQGSPPEVAAVEPISDYIDDDAIGDGSDHSLPTEEITDGLFETPDVYAFFAREFFPEPGCERARRRGLSIYELLSETYPAGLLRDYFRINAGWSYLMARATGSQTGGVQRPPPGTLGREHLLFYLPLAAVLPDYRETGD